MTSSYIGRGCTTRTPPAIDPIKVRKQEERETLRHTQPKISDVLESLKSDVLIRTSLWDNNIVMYAFLTVDPVEPIHRVKDGSCKASGMKIFLDKDSRIKLEGIIPKSILLTGGDYAVKGKVMITAMTEKALNGRLVDNG